MNRTEDELDDVLHLFYIKHALTDAGITYHGLSNSGILELYNTFLGSRVTQIPEGEQRSRKINLNANNVTKEQQSKKEIKESKPEDESTNPGISGIVDQSTNPGNSVTEDQSAKSDISSLSNLFSKQRIKSRNCIDDSIDVFNSVPNYLAPLEPACITPRYNAPPYCNQQYSYSTPKEKTDQLFNYHLMLKKENEYYQNVSKRRAPCGNPLLSRVHKINLNTNVLKSFKGILTELSNLKQYNQYQTFIFNANKKNVEPQPHCSSQPDVVDESNDGLNITPRAGNFGLNDLLNLAVLDNPPSTLSNWIDSKISSSPYSTPTRDEIFDPRPSFSKKRPLSPEAQAVKRTKVSESSTARDDVPVLADKFHMTPRFGSSDVRQRVPDSVRVETEPKMPRMPVAPLMTVTGLENKFSSDSPEDTCGRLPYALCSYCHHFYECNPKVNHLCASPMHSPDYSLTDSE